VSRLTLVHLGDLHFGAHVDLDQIAALERLVPELRPDAIAISGDLTQRARHGEFQRALALVETFRRTAPTLIVAGNHDTTWWRSPFDLLGTSWKHAKYRRYFGDDLGPVLERPGMIMVGALTAHGLAAGSVTWNLRDLTVKGHLPRRETDRSRGLFAQAPAAAARVLVIHHNVLRGEISRRMGLAHWRDAHRRLAESGADLVLCGHDHQESVGQIDGRVVVAAAGTHTSMSRGHRPSVFNLVTLEADAVTVRYFRWQADERRFVPADEFRFARARVALLELPRASAGRVSFPLL
jgi:3',5'-cyclic AMP phosphodiesterase CpdA